MLTSSQNDKKFLFVSVFLHLIIFLALIVSFNFSSKMPVLENSDKNNQIVNAMVMDAPPVPQKKIIPHPVLPKPVLTKPKPQKPVAEKVQPIPEKKAIAISDKKEKKRLQDKFQQQLLSDLKTQTEHEKKIKHKAVVNAFEKEMRDLTAKNLQQQMLQEQKRLAGAARSQQMQGIVDKYKALILQAISQNWIVPPSVDKKLYAELLISLAPGGVVLDVQVVKSSGDESLDRSAQAAVFKSSPLPVPHDSDGFEPFRQFQLRVKPENILNGDIV